MFDRVVFISLKRRPDRREAFFSQPEMRFWPWPEPSIFWAVDGWQKDNPLPPTWRSGNGSYGCRQSHVAVLAQAIADGCSSLLVLEDDAVLCEQFAERASAFCAAVPDDWNCLWIGGQHRGPKISVAPGIVRAMNAQRTHAYAVRGRCLRYLHDLWAAMTTGHIDHLSGQWQSQFNVYAPEPFLIGQAAGMSDIRRCSEPLRFWSGARPARVKHRHVRRRDATHRPDHAPT